MGAISPVSIEARYYAKEGDKYKCQLCPHGCLIGIGVRLVLALVTDQEMTKFAFGGFGPRHAERPVGLVDVTRAVGLVQPLKSL